MELQLTNSFDFKIDNFSEVQLPIYIKRLNPQDVSKDAPRSEIIVAAGFDITDQKITLITGDGRILLFDTKKYCVPKGPAVPCNGGKEIFFENIGDRWPGNSIGFFCDAKWIIEKSISAMTGATISINRNHKNNIK